MVRSGLQQDVINLYRQGVKVAMSKSNEARPAFLLFLRYNFRHPHLRQRDYTAIEHQLRKMSRTLEMLEDAGVQRVSVSDEMEGWWAEEVAKARATASTPSSAEGQVLKKDSDGRDKDQWAGRLPGHGGT